MKRVIDGKMYNTETAEELASAHNGLNASDFDYVEESLYRTKKGAFFLGGDGGARSKYARRVGNGTCEGSGIIPLTEDEALVWLEENHETELIEELFGDQIVEA